MTEQPKEPIKLWAVVFASADRSDMGMGMALCWTEDEALEHIRREVRNAMEGQWDDAEYESQAEADAAWEESLRKLNKMTLRELQMEYADIADGGDWIQEVWVQEHTLTPLPDVSSPDKIEQFLEER